MIRKPVLISGLLLAACSPSFEQSLADPKVDEFCIVHSYEIAPETKEVHTPDGRKYNLEGYWDSWPDDGIYVALFLGQNALIRAQELPRTKAEPILGGQDPKCIKKEDYKG